MSQVKYPAKMASVKVVLDDLGENFLLCSICLDHFKEPKLLPCLHRFCNDCLKNFTLKHRDNLKCPDCQKDFTVPEDGFKTDFCVKSITEYVQLKQSLQTEKIETCYGCSKELKVTAFCFKCHGFLCQSCRDIHETNNIAKDHLSYMVKWENFESCNLTMEKLISLKEAPKCSIHPEKVSELCCKSCNNLPICMACGTFGEHKGHDLQEITSLAKTERRRLIEKMEAVQGIKDNIFKMPGVLREKEKKLDLTASAKKEELSSRFKERQCKIKERVKKVDESYENEKARLENIFRTRTSALKTELEKDMKILKEKYEKAYDEEKRKKDELLAKLLDRSDKNKTKMAEYLKTVEHDLSELISDCQKKEKENRENIQELGDHFEGVIKRFENIQSTASSILAANHDWTDMRCIPDICTAIDDLMKDAGMGIPDDVTDIDVGTLKLVFVEQKDKVKLSENADATVAVDIGPDEASIKDIAGNKYGSIVVTGEYSSGKSHITVIDINGKKLRQFVIQSDPIRYCSFLSRYKVATVCRPNEIGIYDILDGTYMRKNISDVTHTWRADQNVLSVGTDATNNLIVVSGLYTRYMAVFNGNLNFLHTISLPDIASCPSDMVHMEDDILICDIGRGSGQIITMKGLTYELMGELPKPVDRSWPRSVCIDANEFIYILWKKSDGRGMVSQYSQDGRQILTSVSVEGDPRKISIARKGQRHKLLVASNKEIAIYSLTDE